MKTILTYGTFDLFHVGHLNVLSRLRSLGDKLIVGVSTDEFNSAKGKQTVIPFQDRIAIVSSLKCVDVAIPEASWDQKVQDIAAHSVDVFGMGDDWIGKFDDLKNYCEVVYLPRTPSISSTELKRVLKVLDKKHIADLKTTLDLIGEIVTKFDN